MENECSKLRRCVGIEHIRTVGPKKLFIACLDSIYKSTASDKYKGLTNQLFKKVSSYVFPQDFLNSKNDAHVRKNRNKTDKEFFPERPWMDEKTSSYVTVKDCKLYCASERRCCGCIKVCNDTCRWNTLTDCERPNDSNPAKKQNLSRKPVCFDVHLNIVGETLYENSTILNESSTARWKLGACGSLNSIEIGEKYQYPAVYTERCCLESGRHILVCYNYPPSRGW